MLRARYSYAFSMSAACSAARARDLCVRFDGSELVVVAPLSCCFSDLGLAGSASCRSVHATVPSAWTRNECMFSSLLSIRLSIRSQPLPCFSFLPPARCRSCWLLLACSLLLPDAVLPRPPRPRTLPMHGRSCVCGLVYGFRRPFFSSLSSLLSVGLGAGWGPPTRPCLV